MESLGDQMHSGLHSLLKVHQKCYQAKLAVPGPVYSATAHSDPAQTKAAVVTTKPIKNIGSIKEQKSRVPGSAYTINLGVSSSTPAIVHPIRTIHRFLLS